MSAQITVLSEWPGARFGVPSVNAVLPGAGDEEYAVGYRKPPAHTRWKRGVSGNPSGKKKTGANSIFAAINAKMDEEVAYNDKGRRRKMTRLEAGATQFSLKIAQGDPLYLKLYLEYAAKGLLRPLPPPASAQEVEAEDLEIIALAKKKRGEQ